LHLVGFFFNELYYDAQIHEHQELWKSSLFKPPRQNAARRYPLQLCGADIITLPFALTWDFMFDPVHETMFFCTATNVRLFRVACAASDDKDINPTHITTPYFLIIRFNIIPPYTPWSPNWIFHFGFSER